MAKTLSFALASWILCALAPAWSCEEKTHLSTLHPLTPKPQQNWIKPQDGPGGFLLAPVGALDELQTGNLNNLERDMAYLLETREQLPDGTFRLETIATSVMDTIQAYGTSDAAAMEPIKCWKEAMPDSPEEPIVEAITWRALAWAARGNTYAGEVNPAGMELFETRATQAANVLIESKARSSVNPLWYLEMMRVGRDLGWDRPRVEAILKEGMKRFPEFHALPREMVNYLAPKWYGDHNQERAFIEKTVVTVPKENQAELYTRLYLTLQDTMGLTSSNFFAATGASWPRIKKGFEDMSQRYPNSFWNLNHYAAWACIAGDKPTYASARSRLRTTIYKIAWFPKNPIEICDQRLAYTQQVAAALPSSEYKQMRNPRVNDGPAADSWIGHRYAWLFETKAFEELDTTLAQVATRLDQTDDGSFHAYTAGAFMGFYFTDNASHTRDFEAALAEWRQRSPQSVGEPIVESIYWRSMGEVLRRRSSVRDDSKEGAQLFGERLRKAQAILTASRERSIVNPLWYTEQIRVGRDLGWSKERLLKVYNEGIAKYPTFDPLTRQMAVSLLPMWGGSYAAVEQFAVARANALPKEFGGESYARIYWSINDADECIGGERYCMIFDASRVSWLRMQEGFDDMMKRFPKSLWNANNYAAFACLAKDKAAYGRIRPKLGRELFLPAWPANATPEVCDHALLTAL
jgi:hypothetical protein